MTPFPGGVTLAGLFGWCDELLNHADNPLPPDTPVAVTTDPDGYGADVLIEELKVQRASDERPARVILLPIYKEEKKKG